MPANHDGPHLAAQYLRMSTDQQRYSLRNQAKLIADYATACGYEVCRTYQDAGRSGLSLKGRDGLKALLADVMSGSAPFSTILVLDVSRWGRFQDPDQAAHYEFLCREAGVSVRYCAEAFDDDGTPSAALMKSIKRVMAAEYSRQLSDRCRAGLQRVRHSGAKGGGSAPYGFARQAFEPNGQPGPVLRVGERRPRIEQVVRLVQGVPEEVAAVRLIFQLFVRDMRGIAEIARTLNSRGIPYRRVKPWDASRVKGVLTNEIAAGVHVFDRTVCYLGKTTVYRPPEMWARVSVVEPIVSCRTFSAASAKLKSTRGRIGTDQELLAKLRPVLRKHGALSTDIINGAPGVPRAAAYIKRFGSLWEVYRRLGYDDRGHRGRRLQPEEYEADAILAALRSLWERRGYLNSTAINRSRDLPTVGYITRKFGSLTAAYERLGYDLSKGEMIVAGNRRRRAGPHSLGLANAQDDLAHKKPKSEDGGQLASPVPHSAAKFQGF